MFKLRYHFLLVTCLALFSGCEKEVVLDLDDEQSLAVFSLFTPNSIFANNSFVVEVTSTQSILDNSNPEFITDAEVTITSIATDNPVDPVMERLTTSLNGDDRLVYSTDSVIPQEGFEYELHIDHPNFPSVTSRSIIPPVTNITSLEFDTFKKSRENELPGFTRYFTTVNMQLPNNNNRDDFYHLLVWLLVEDVWNPTLNRFQDELRPIDIGREVLQEQLGTDAIVVNVNNSPVFLGAHFGDETFTGAFQDINFDVSFSLTENGNPTEIIAELRSVPRDYHRYFVDGFRVSESGNSPFFVNNNNITNNIEGGFGIFAGYTASDFRTPFRE